VSPKIPSCSVCSLRSPLYKHVSIHTLGNCDISIKPTVKAAWHCLLLRIQLTIMVFVDQQKQRASIAWVLHRHADCWRWHVPTTPALWVWLQVSN
jgi:hypothetical protein